ncbi:hypothetical protein JVU11DRAFT_1750 [Chiua virens]|nr:hypothetical protein JVU11DRAFT_1750 [Chiua virens]
MDQERHRFVQQYVERQKVYLPTYTAVDPLIESNGTPLKPPPKSDEYGFDTPVLRPRAPVKSPQAQLALQAGSSKSRLRTHEADLPNQTRPPTLHRDARPDLAKKGKPRTKRKKDPTPTVDTDDERAARLADRQERKRKKRTIVDPPQTHDHDVEPTAAPKKGRTSGQKARKPAALALLYGFSATNVTKDRLTVGCSMGVSFHPLILFGQVKPAPSLGVFNKGKASVKKKVAATKRASSRNELFSESAFLNKSNSNRRAADSSKLDDNSDDGSVSSNPQEHDKKNRIGTAGTKAPQASTRIAAESEVWDIELQSKLPSFVRDVSSELRAQSSVPVIMDLHRAVWSTTLDAAEKHAECLGKTRTPSVVVTRCRSEEHSVIRSSPLVISNLRDQLGLALAADASSIHPSHSASQELPATPPQASKSTAGIEALDSRIPEQDDVRDAALDVEAIRRVASPINSLISAPQIMIPYKTRYDMVPLEFPSDSSPYEGFCAEVNVHRDFLGRPDRGYVEPCSNVEPCHSWDWCQPWSPVGLAIDDVDIEAIYDDPLASECADHLNGPEALVDACYFETQAELDPEDEQDGWCAAETRHDLPIYEDETVDEVSSDGEEDVPGFLEGRALLLGIPDEHEGRVRCVGVSGLAQAEMDVASRLRNHWRPLRL